MAPPILIRTSIRSHPSLCLSYAVRAPSSPGAAARRWINLNALARDEEAQKQWVAQAEEIKAGRQKSMFKKLEERGYVHDVTGTREEVERMMTETRAGAYVGIDPTASSLHVGHMLPLMSLFWMYVHGYRTVTLIGGATATIGDPTDRLTTREKTDSSVRAKNMVSMHCQLENLWLNLEAYKKKYGYASERTWSRALYNNKTWWDTLPMLEVLQVLGPGMRMGSMLARDTVKNKMKKGDGMSYAEFSYPIMQAWDWWTMYQGDEIQMQIGGSDQFGNITAGVDAVKYIAANHPNKDVREEASTRGMPFGFTAPLLTTSSGQKFGKSAGNAIWLDSDQTSSFELYKHFLGTSDADVGRYLKLFTFMPIEQIDALVQDHMRSPQQRKAQHKLAREFVELVHGVEQAKHAESQHRLIFENSMTSEGDAVAKPNLEATSSPSPIQSLTPIEGTTAQVGNLEAHIKLPRSAVEGSNIGRVLLACGLVPSASEGHRLAARGSVHVGGLTGGSDQGMATIEGFLTFTPVDSWSTEYAQKSLIDDKLLILRRGKSHVRIFEVVSDPEYQKLGLSYPGMRIHEEGSRDLEIEGPKLT